MSSDIVRVLNVFPLSAADRERLSAVSPRLHIEHAEMSAIKELADPELEVLVANRVPDLSRNPKLRWMQAGSAGVDHLIEAAPWKHGIVLTNARGVYAVPLAEYVMTAMLAASQKVDRRRVVQDGGRWPPSEVEFEATGLRGRTVVIVGYGTTGRELARLASAFGMRVLAVKARPDVLTDTSFRIAGTGDPDGKIPERVVGLDQVAEVAREADYLALTLPLTERSRGVISREVLESLPSHAWVVNVARGAVVDEDALIDVLASGRIAGAWLDVFTKEPLPPESPLWNLSNVTLTPHLAGGNDGSWNVLTDLLIENFKRYLDHRPLLNVVDGKRQY
ncbi:MAG TPA: D-2-hydroxyacid dehydrogenase [Candidatus Dormibacteraeota bacterium]|nr:D-2-hydroxyacid dehydrogenase [Candidatus Dormibacteraeota bacterium]